MSWDAPVFPKVVITVGISTLLAGGLALVLVTGTKAAGTWDVVAMMGTKYGILGEIVGDGGLFGTLVAVPVLAWITVFRFLWRVMGS